MVASFLAQSSSSENQMQIANELSSHQLMTIFTALIYAPIVEEIVFRGVLFRNLRAKLSFGYAALISAFAFGLMHVFSALISGNISDIWYLLVYGGLGFIFCYLYEKEKTIYAPMLLHLLNNGIAILFMLLI